MSDYIKAKTVKEPLFHIVKRASMPMGKAVLCRVSAVITALIISGLLSVILVGVNPFKIYKSLFIGITYDPWGAIKDAAFLLGFGLAVLPAFKMKFWNMGANGQVTMGCLAAIACMRAFPGKMPEEVVMLLMILSSIILSIVWAVIPAVFKAFFNTNETLFTLMMNYIAVGIVNHCIFTWTGGRQVTLGQVNLMTEFAWFPKLGNNYILSVLVIALITVFVYIYMKYSKHGYEISVVGGSQNTARYVGIDVKKVTIRTMVLSGAICGVLGALYAGAISHSVSSSTATLGFTAILVTWLAKFDPFVMAGVSFFVVYMNVGATQISTDFLGGNKSFSDIIIGIIFFCVIGCEFLISYQIKKRKKEGSEADVSEGTAEKKEEKK